MNNKLTIVADENMPHLDFLFANFAKLIKIPGRSITATDVKSADALFCRSVTSVDQKLLEKSTVKFIGSATIGIDHLKTTWLNKQGITWTNAAGCNAAAVAQYVVSGISYWLKKKRQGKRLNDLAVGIIGAGNVGTELARCLTILGCRVLLCDPLLKVKGDPRNFVELKHILQCDVISIHVPLTQGGSEATYHLIDDMFMQQLTSHQLVINAARGEVIDNVALFQYLNKTDHADFILDVFENEPAIHYQLADKCLLATPHIAGHTIEGKSRGSFMIYHAFCHYFNLQPDIFFNQLLPKKNELLDNSQDLSDMDSLLTIYDIAKDSALFLNAEPHLIAEHFDQLRKHYASTFKSNPRRDYSGWNKVKRFSSVVNELMS